MADGSQTLLQQSELLEHSAPDALQLPQNPPMQVPLQQSSPLAHAPPATEHLVQLGAT
jgi:hypothetical protein